MLAEARAGVPALAKELTLRHLAAVPEVAAAGPEVTAAMHASTLSALELFFAGFAADRTLPAELPPDAREFVRMLARLGVGLDVLLRLYRIGHAVTWERWLELTQKRIADPEQRTAAIADASRYMFDWIDLAATRLAELHAGEHEAVRRSRERRALEAVRALLAGGDMTSADAHATLGYDLDTWHLALVVTGPDVETVAAGAAEALGASQSLVAPLSAEVAWAWVGRRRPFADDLELRELGDSGVAAGQPAEGRDGFRRSHAQAREAHRVRELSGSRFASYGDCGLLALTVRDAEAARMYYEAELHGIDGDDARSRALRETLLAWFAAGHNGASAAAALGAHENTVANRLRAVERRLGRPLASRRAELEIALRLRELLRADH